MNSLLPDRSTLIIILSTLSLILLGLLFTRLLPQPEKDRKRTAGFRVIACGALFLGSFYLFWLYRRSLNLQALWFALPLSSWRKPTPSSIPCCSSS